MKKLLWSLIATLCLSYGVASAQQSKSDETLEFKQHWTISLQGGAAYTEGEAKFNELISPAAQVSATYNFHNMMGVRIGIGGWQGKGSVAVTGEAYKFKFFQFNADYMLDIMNLVGGYKHNRLLNPYVFAGIGAGKGYDNGEAAKYLDNYAGVLKRYWKKTPLLVARAGVGANINVTNKLALGMELNANMYPEKFNSKQRVESSCPDWHFNLMVGLTYALGSKTAPSKAYAAKVAEQEALALAKKAEEERIAAQKAAEEERIAAQKAAEEAAAKKAAEEAAAKKAAEDNSIHLFFTIDSYSINEIEGKKLEKLAQWMIANPNYNVAVVGYADAKTGTPAVNARVSAKRVEVVADRLVKLGVPAERIVKEAKGDKEQPFAENKKNRVVFCTLF